MINFMRQKGNFVIIIAVIIVALLAGYALMKNSKETAPVVEAPKETGPIKIGVILPLTGDGAAYGEPARAIYTLAAKEINDAGGVVDGRTIEFVIEDDKCTGEGGANAAQKLVNVDKVKIILGGICSSATLAALPVAEKAGVALFSPGASSPDLTGKSPLFARNYPGDSAQGKILADIAYNKEGAKTIYLLVEQTDYAKGVAKVLDETFTSFGGKVTTEEFPSSVTDVRVLVTKAKAAKPDVFMISAQTPATAQKVFKAMSDLKWKPKLFVNDVIPGDAPTMSQYKTLLNGAITAEVGTDENNEIFKHVLELYKTAERSDMPFQSYGQMEWDAVFLIRDGVKAVGNDGAKFAAWLRTVKDWKGAAGSVTIGADGDPLVGHRAEIIKDGKTEVLK